MRRRLEDITKSGSTPLFWQAEYWPGCYGGSHHLAFSHKDISEL